MRIAFPHAPGSGGPGSFQTRFQADLVRRGWEIQLADAQADALPDVVFVVGGTRKLPWLHRMRRKGVPIVYRLDGLLWLHRVPGASAGPKMWLEAEGRNALAQWIHGRLADVVIYQSEFVRNWWSTKGWKAPRAHHVIHNGADLSEFRPSIDEPVGANPPEVVCVEGHVDYSPYAVDVLNHMGTYLQSVGSRLIVYGAFVHAANRARLDASVDYRGSIPRSGVPEVLRNRIYLSLDVNPACPNAVSEAMASGAPVLGFDSGAVKELVGEEAGQVVPFGSDPWSGAYPKIDSLPAAYERIAADFAGYSRRARQRAVDNFDLLRVVDSYVAVIEGVLRR